MDYVVNYTKNVRIPFTVCVGKQAWRTGTLSALVKKTFFGLFLERIHDDKLVSGDNSDP